MALPLTPASLASLPLIGTDVLQPGDGLYFAGTDALSRVIEDLTGSIVGHVAVVVIIGGQAFVLEAYAPFVRLVPLNWYLTNYNNTGKPYPGSIIVGRWNSTTSQQIDAAIAFGMRQLGISYSDWTLAEIAVHMIDRELPPILPDGKHWVCSQMFQSEYFAGGMPIPDNEDGTIYPGDCWTVPQIAAVGLLLANQ